MKCYFSSVKNFQAMENASMKFFEIFIAQHWLKRGTTKM